MTPNQPIARPAFCRHCGCAIWRQVMPFTVEADCQPLQSAAEELTFRAWGRWTYQVHKIAGGFELVPRHGWNITPGDYQRKIVLPDHACTNLPRTDHPNYWPTDRQEAMSNDAPF